jgi:hypothetical protein
MNATRDLITVLRRRLEVETRHVWQLSDCSSRPGGPAPVEDALVLTCACPQNEHVRNAKRGGHQERPGHERQSQTHATQWGSEVACEAVDCEIAQSRLQLQLTNVSSEGGFATARTRPLLGRRRIPDSRS